jgi:hypothetical protein
MAKFWIDYSTSVLIEAETAEEAKEIFWNGDYDALGCGEIQIDGFEEVED